MRLPSDEGAQQERDGWFTGFRTARTPRLKLLVSEVVNEILAYETENDIRRRKRKAVDLEIFERQVEALICDAALCHVERPGCYVSITLSHRKLSRRDRYRSQVLSDTIPNLLKLLGPQHMHLLDVVLGHSNPIDRSQSKQTTFRVSPALLSRLIPLELTPAHFGIHPDQESIVLKDFKKGPLDKGTYLQYCDTPQTIAYRSDLKTINDWIDAADIDLAVEGSSTRLRERRVRRVFNNGGFDLGGRLFGGWWQEMSKKDRLNILIDGIPIVTLDFAQMGPRILYGMAGASFDCDAYAVPGFESHRAGIKKLFAAMTYTATPLKKFPKGTADLFRGAGSVQHVTESIQAHHSAIFGSFYAGAGLAAMHRESEIMVAMLLKLQECRIVALPIHDALIVAEDRVEEVRAVMLSTFHAHTGVQGSVQVECLKQHDYHEPQSRKISGSVAGRQWERYI